jgi:type I restriction enzyme S subunit
MKQSTEKAFESYVEEMLLASGCGQSNISQDKIRSIRVASPPLPEQTTIATYLDRETAKIDRLVETVEAAVGRLQVYRSALITAAVTGKIDVREAVTSHAETV